MYLISFSFTINPNSNEIFFSFSKVSVIVCLVRTVINISSAYAEYSFKSVEMLPVRYYLSDTTCQMLPVRCYLSRCYLSDVTCQMLPVRTSCFKMSSMTARNRDADSGSPCFTSFNISKFSV